MITTIINDSTVAALQRCMDLNIPFALYANPDDSNVNFFASMPDQITGENIADLSDSSEWNGFAITFFNRDPDVVVGVRDELKAEDILSLPQDFKALPEAEIVPVNRSTNFIHYYAQVHEILAGMKKEYQKVVHSRLIAVKSTRPIIDIVRDYFQETPDCFRFFYFTQETGMWLGASPELLLKHECNSNSFKSVALAGTRQIGIASQWDEKNIIEHNFVEEFLENTFHTLGLTVEKNDLKSVRFGQIEHLKRDYTAVGEIDFEDLINMLSPTPALAGLPQHKAIEVIERFETHSRYCYGGWVCVREPETTTAYVNLRNSFILPGKESSLFNLYAGGGLVKESDAIKEWQEAASKASRLYSIVVKGNQLPTPNASSLADHLML